MKLYLVFLLSTVLLFTVLLPTVSAQTPQPGGGTILLTIIDNSDPTRQVFRIQNNQAQALHLSDISIMWTVLSTRLTNGYWNGIIYPKNSVPAATMILNEVLPGGQGGVLVLVFDDDPGSLTFNVTAENVTIAPTPTPVDWIIDATLPFTNPLTPYDWRSHPSTIPDGLEMPNILPDIPYLFSIAMAVVEIFQDNPVVPTIFILGIGTAILFGLFRMVTGISGGGYADAEGYVNTGIYEALGEENPYEDYRQSQRVKAGINRSKRVTPWSGPTRSSRAGNTGVWNGWKREARAKKADPWWNAHKK